MINSKAIFSKFLWFLFKNPKSVFRLRQSIEKFMREYTDQVLARNGYKFERDVNEILRFIRIALIGFICQILIILMVPAKEYITPQHLKACKDETLGTISFNKFLMDYVRDGKIQSITCYPLHQKAIAFLRPSFATDAAVDDDDDNDNNEIDIVDDRSALKIDLNEEMCSKPAEITEKIRAFEQQTNVKEPMEISIIKYKPLTTRLVDASNIAVFQLVIFWLMRGKLFQVTLDFKGVRTTGKNVMNWR